MKVKLTKSALNKFIVWSTSRYNNYLGYGNKKENVELIFNALKEGNHKGQTIFRVECAQGAGESGAGRYWKVKGGSDNYFINCETKTIEGEYSKRLIEFL